jgi:hypothetical protein
MYATREHDYTFQLNDNKMEVVYNGWDNNTSTWYRINKK